ncbi:MAG: 50S ribosomal protein L21 [Pseudomonadota bacterium]|nr:50S ribosomal protein L21 [Pseudomonadota bacterium]
MYVIFEHKDKQYKVMKGDVLKLPRNEELKKGDSIKFENILLFSNDSGVVQIGSPLVKDCVVEAEVIEQIRDKKILVFKKKRRHNYRRKIGHRQDLTLVRILNISSKKNQGVKSDNDVKKKSEKIEDKNGT